MPSMSARLSILLFGLVALLTMTARGAWASTFDVYPVRVELSQKRGKSALLTVSNRGKEPLRLQASAFAWSQSEAGEVELAETTDIVFFPSMLTIAPGASRKIRVGTNAPIGAREQTYRLIVEELPTASSAPSNGIRILTRMSIPIFLQPDAPRSIAHIESVGSKGKELAVTIGNRGNASFILRHITVTARDASGSIVFERELPGWYLLAASKREFRFPIPEDACKRIANGVVEAKGQSDAVHAQLEIPVLRCES